MFDRGPTVQDASDAAFGKSRGFDYLRLILAVSVIFWHSFQINYGDIPIGIFRLPVVMILPMFFALSGYLISGSLFRVKNIHEFVALRAIRIIPALAVETVLSIILIGALYTTLPPTEYWTNRQVFSYALNVVGYVHRSLPGVFELHPVPLVNAPLWTIPFELECYLGIVMLWVVGIVRRPAFLLPIIILLQIAIPAWEISRWGVIAMPYGVRGRVLLLSFLCGVAIYLYRRVVRLHWTYFLVALGLCGALLSTYATSYFVAAPAAYVTVYLGLKNPRKLPIVLAGDFSYGIYLYGFPIQQALYSSFPAYRVWWFNLSAALLISSLFAAFSWFAIERPVLGARKQIVGLLDRMLAAVSGDIRPIRALPDSPIQAKLGAENRSIGRKD